MFMKKVSIIIPVYKVERYLRKCLDSVVNQTYTNLEIIIVDDGSPDNCGSICDEYSQKDNRIQVIHKKNEGLCAARNDALKKVTGEWILFVDSDDWCELDLCEKAVTRAEKDDVDILIYNPYRSFENGKEEKIQAFPEEFVTTDKKIIHGMQLSALDRHYTPFSTEWCQGFPWDKLFRTSLIFDNNITFATNVRANEDVIFDLHAFQFAQKISYMNEFLYHYRYNPTSIATKYTPDRVQIDRDIYEEMLNIGKKYSLSDDYFSALYARTVQNAIMWGQRCFFHSENKGKLFDRINAAKDALKSEPAYSAFEKVDRKKLGKTGKFVTIFRHHNLLLIWLVTKIIKYRRKFGIE